MWVFNKRIIITTVIIGDGSASWSCIILIIVWNDISLWKILVPLANLLFLAVGLLAKFLFPFTTSVLIEPNVRKRWWAVD